MHSIETQQLTPKQQELCLKLLEIGGVRFGSFKLKLHDKNPEAPLSPIFIDLRVVQRFPEVKHIVVDVYEQIVKPLTFDVLAGIPIAAVALVSSLSDRINVGMITPRITVKTHGSGLKVDGANGEQDKDKIAVLIDDLASKADSKFEAANVLEEFGFVVNDIVVLIDREQGGGKQLADAGYTLHAAFTLSQMLTFYLDAGKITRQQFEEIHGRMEALRTFTS